MAGYSITIIEGNVGRDPELRYTPSGSANTQMTVAVSRNYKNKENEWIEETTWYRCVIWGDQAERAAEQLHKGSKVLVEGRMQTREYTKEEVKHVVWELVVNRYVMLDPKPRAATDDDRGNDRPSRRAASTTKPARTEEPTDDLSDLDELPFS